MDTGPTGRSSSPPVANPPALKLSETASLVGNLAFSGFKVVGIRLPRGKPVVSPLVSTPHRWSRPLYPPPPYVLKYTREIQTT